jgi:hypothetical protein
VREERRRRRERKAAAGGLTSDYVIDDVFSMTVIPLFQNILLSCQLFPVTLNCGRHLAPPRGTDRGTDKRRRGISKHHV